MKRSRISAFGGLALALSTIIGSGCQPEGPAEEAGKKIDNAADALNPKGPMEKAGEKVDDAVK